MLVKEKKVNNLLVSINNIEDIDIYKKEGVSSFLFALKDFSIGYEKEFTIEELNKIDCDKYIIVNRVLDNSDIDKFINIIDSINCDKFVIEDIGLIKILKDRNKKVYLYMNHFNCNSLSINKWLEYVDSVFVSNELTYDELERITIKTSNKVILNVFGYNQVMYSRRYLLKNFYDYYKLNYSNTSLIKDRGGLVKFVLREFKYGTVCYSSKIFDGRRLFNLDNVLLYYVNTSFIDRNDVIKFIHLDNIDNSDSGFLDKKTIFKLEAKK